MKTNYYILKDKKIVKVDLLTWSQWFENADNKRIALDKLPNGKRASTVFLGIDHGWGEGPPLLFETMVFSKNSYEDLDMERYSTYEEAEKGHKKMVKKWSKELK